MKGLFFFPIFMFSFNCASHAQILTNGVLRPAIFFDVRFSEAEVLSVSEEQFIVSLKYDLKQDREYKIGGVALNEEGEEIAEIAVAPQDLALGEGVVDLTFRFEKKSGQEYLDPIIETASIRVQLFREFNLGGLVDESKIPPTATMTYPFEHIWRVGGGHSMIIDVTLQPIGRARFIQPE